jgi:hypothetical protein
MVEEGEGGGGEGGGWRGGREEGSCLCGGYGVPRRIARGGSGAVGGGTGRAAGHHLVD